MSPVNWVRVFVLLLVQLAFGLYSIVNSVFPYQSRVGKGMVHLIQADEKPYVSEIFGFFWEIRDFAKHRSLFLPTQNYVTTNDEMGLGLPFFLRYVAEFELLPQSESRFQILSSEREFRTHLIRVFEEPIIFEHSSMADGYILRPGSPIRIQPIGFLK